jgi:hypothetical protein
VEVSHTDLSEVTGMVLVDVGPVVVLTTGHTTTTGMLAVLSCEELDIVDGAHEFVAHTDTSVSGGDVTAVLAGL